jgi:hypothetical protein
MRGRSSALPALPQDFKKARDFASLTWLFAVTPGGRRNGCVRADGKRHRPAWRTPRRIAQSDTKHANSNAEFEALDDIAPAVRKTTRRESPPDGANGLARGDDDGWLGIEL